ncbi:MAG: protein kinase [Acidobacteria bacterium]|nr:protein kinase [Acidobacteriota bacterium]MCB9378241.1 protein kinase [Holophagales bacterium]
MASSLRSGTTLGPYRIVAPLGAGGMGEVFRAHDAKLDRPVALKILPASVVRDAERVRRFVQEARSASSLSHPNIVTIHDIGEAVPIEEGAEAPAPDAEPCHYIAMELVEGATLRKLLDDRSIEPRTLLTHLAQAAEGLAKAHAAGIVHRDLKPENIMVTRDGYAKVLDFGLAKLTEKSTSGSALAAAPTAYGDDQTREGQVMGTVGYMSPEQAMGKPVDHRTDLFAFGCLLYEAATGRKPFTGESDVDVLHAIVREKPTPVEEIAPQIPRALVRTIRRCLAKEPDRRYQSMKDLALELHDMVDEWDTLATPSGTVTTGSALSGVAPARPGGLGRAGWIAIAVAAVALAVTGLLLWRGGRAPTPAPSAFQEMRFTAATTTGDVSHATLSPDGRYLAAVRSGPGGDSLQLRQLATGSDVELVPPQGSRGLRNPVFTPDGEYVTYTLSDEQRALFTLYRMPVLGGAARPVVTDIDTPVAFSPDGRRIAYLRNSVEERAQRLFLASAEGGDETELAVRRSDDGAGFDVSSLAVGPSWSPDGRSIAVIGWDRTGEFRQEVLLVDVESGEVKRLGETVWLGASGVDWDADGASLIFAGSPKGTAFVPQLWRIAVPSGAVARITNDSQNYRGVSVSADGRLLASVQGSSSATLWRRPLGGVGEDRQLTFSSRENLGGLVGSSDAIFFNFQRGREAGVARIDPAGGEPFTLTRPEIPSTDASVSRDGRTIVLRSLLPDGRIGLRAMDGRGGNVRTLPDLGTAGDFAIHPDGAWYAARDEKGIWRMPLDGGEPTLLVAEPNASPIDFTRAGDRLLFGVSRPDGSGSLRHLLVVVPATGGAPVAEFERPRGLFGNFRWSPDGRSLTLLAREGDDSSLFRMSIESGELTRIADFPGVRVGSYRISDDGATIYFTKGVQSSDAIVIENF